mgnify:FL=1
MAITKKNRREFIEDMFFKLENVPIEQIVGSRVPLKQQGAHLYGSCPFHSSTHHRSFVVTPRKNIWHCFVCGDGFGGNGIKFISLYDNIDYLQAAFKVAYENNIISYDEYIMYSKINYNETYVNRLEQKHVGSKKIAVTAKPKAPDFIIHNVYSIIKENCSLSEEDYKTLKNERHLSDTRIARDYFTAPTNWKQKENILNAIRAAYPEYTDEILMTVPGFYIEPEKGKNRLKFSFAKGIAFCIRTDTKIKAIQIRRYTVKEGQKRYTWFSSSFTDAEPDKYLGGAGCGSPHDILYPDNTDKGIIAITEGRFKSEILRDAGNVAISLQGVSTWKGIQNEILHIMDSRPVRKIYLFYDSDMLGNTAVYNQSIALLKAIEITFPTIQTYHAVWKKEWGKGIDDMYFNGHIKKIKYLTSGQLKSCHEKVLIFLLKKYGVESLDEIVRSKDKDLKERFCRDLQDNSEKAIFEGV